MITVTPATRIAAVLKEYPQALEAIISVNPAFEKLRNPLLRKLLAGRVSIRDASRIGKCSVDDFYFALLPLGIPLGDFSAQENKSEKTAEIFTDEQRRLATPLDVRADLAAHKDPLEKIMHTLRKAKPGEVIALINDFEPVPLLRLLEKKGFRYEVQTTGDTVVTYISAAKPIAINEEEPQPYLDEAAFRQLQNSFSDRLHSVDVSRMEMPGPMVTILGELDRLPEHHGLFVVHRKMPLLLLPELQERDFEIAACRSKENVLLLICRAEDLPR